MGARFPWYETAGLLVALVLVESARRARLQGIVVVTPPSRIADQCMVDEKEFDSSRLSDVDPNELRFTIRARRTLLFFKSMTLKVHAGELQLPDGMPLRAGQSRKLPPGVTQNLAGTLGKGPVSFEVTLSL